MSVPLTPEQNKAAEALVEAGVFASKDEAVAYSHEWLRKEAEKLEAIRAAVKESREQSARGESREITSEDIMREVRRRLEEENATVPPV